MILLVVIFSTWWLRVQIYVINKKCLNSIEFWLLLKPIFMWNALILRYWCSMENNYLIITISDTIFSLDYKSFSEKRFVYSFDFNLGCILVLFGYFFVSYFSRVVNHWKFGVRDLWFIFDLIKNKITRSFIIL